MVENVYLNFLIDFSSKMRIGGIIKCMKKLWVVAVAGVTAFLVLAICMPASPAPSRTLAISVTAATTSRFAAPTSVTVSSVTATGATVKFVLPSTDRAATSEQVVVYLASNPSGAPAFSAAVTRSPVTVTGLGPSTGYYAEVSVNAVKGHSASAWKVSSLLHHGEGARGAAHPDSYA